MNPSDLLRRAAETINPMDHSLHLEDMAAEFYEETGKIAPFKDCPAAAPEMAATREEYQTWVRARDGELVSALRKLADLMEKPTPAMLDAMGKVQVDEYFTDLAGECRAIFAAAIKAMGDA